MPLRTGARLAAPAATVLALAGTSPALARGGQDGGGDGGRSEVRAAGTCGKGASSKLKLKARDGRIEAQFEVHHGRAGSTWRVTIVHERQVAYRGRRRIAGPSRSFEVDRRMPDYSGADGVTARATGPRGVVCVASATLPA